MRSPSPKLWDTSLPGRFRIRSWSAIVSSANAAGSTLVSSAIGTVIQQFALFLRDQGYSTAEASRISSALLVSGLAGRIIVGFLADRFRKKNVMALFYLVLATAIPLLLLARHV